MSSTPETIQITARVTAPGSITNTAEVSASGAPDPDSTPNNGTLGDGDDVTLPAVTTDASGNWTVSGLGPGLYRVTVDTATLPTGLDDPTADLDGIGSPDQADLTLGSGETRNDVDFGYEGTATVGDTVFVDYDALSELTLVPGANDPDQDFGFLGTGSTGRAIFRDDNRNGLADEGEGIPGVTVHATWAEPDGVLGNSDDHTYTGITDENGLYLVGNLPGGDYQVEVQTSTLPPGSRSPGSCSGGAGVALVASPSLRSRVTALLERRRAETIG